MKKRLVAMIAFALCLAMGLSLVACGDEHTHTYETVWSTNQAYHWRACTDMNCTGTSQKEAHSFQNDVCSICGFGNTGTDTSIDAGNTDEPTPGTTTGNQSGSNETPETPAVSSYQIVSAPMQNGLIVMDSATDGQKNYYLIDLGYAKNVPIWSGVAVEYNKNQESAPALKFAKGQQSETSVEETISKTISKTVSSYSSSSWENKVGLDLGAESIFFKFSLEVSNSRSWGNTTEKNNSTTNAFTSANSVANSYSTEVSFATGGNGYGWYRLSMLATCDIYAVVETDLDNKTIVSITYTVCPRDDAALTLEYNTHNSWVDESVEKITVPTDQIKNLKKPDKVYMNGNQIEGGWSSDVYTQTVDGTAVSVEDCTTAEIYNGAGKLSITVPEEYAGLVNLGLLQVEVTVTCNASFAYRSNEHSATATINASLGDDSYKNVAVLTATGGGWPALWVDPAYGETVSDTGSTLKMLHKVKEKSFDLNINYQYDIDFEEYKNWAGGTHAVVFSCDLSNVSYRFYVPAK